MRCIHLISAVGKLLLMLAPSLSVSPLRFTHKQTTRPGGGAVVRLRARPGGSLTAGQVYQIHLGEVVVRGVLIILERRYHDNACQCVNELARHEVSRCGAAVLRIPKRAFRVETGGMASNPSDAS